MMLFAVDLGGYTVFTFLVFRIFWGWGGVWFGRGGMVRSAWDESCLLSAGCCLVFVWSSRRWFGITARLMGALGVWGYGWDLESRLAAMVGWMDSFETTVSTYGCCSPCFLVS
ncbi:hypothetical protein BKA80DRAFT_116699 [Phyllosticta citrichinensis]